MIRLMNYINSNPNNPILMMAFSNVESLDVYIEDNQIDAVIISDETYEEIKNRDYGMEILVLTEQDNPSNTYSMSRYSKADDIVSFIMEHMKVEEKNYRNKVFKSYAVTSPLGRCGKTRLAYALCANDQVRGGLYLGFEEYSDCVDETPGMENLLYLAIGRSPGLMDYIEQNAKKIEGMSIIHSPSTYMDIRCVKREDMEYLLETILSSGIYSTVVCDIGGASLSDMDILQCFDRIYMPVLKDQISTAKVQQYKDNLKRQGLNKIASSIRSIAVPDVQSDSPEMLRLIAEVEGV